MRLSGAVHMRMLLSSEAQAGPEEARMLPMRGLCNWQTSHCNIDPQPQEPQPQEHLTAQLRVRPPDPSATQVAGRQHTNRKSTILDSVVVGFTTHDSPRSVQLLYQHNIRHAVIQHHPADSH